jgi:hypothetical protein
VLLAEEAREAFGVTEAALDGDGLDFQISVFDESLCVCETTSDEFITQRVARSGFEAGLKSTDGHGDFACECADGERLGKAATNPTHGGGDAFIGADEGGGASALNDAMR